LVDDQPGKLLSYEAMLADLGENLIKASSGREGARAPPQTDITIVLMDVSMPEIDGFELAEMIQQHPRFRKTAIIFVSAGASERSRSPQGLRVGRGRLRVGAR
jgi:CheY-like chemotaxis protein